MCVSGLRPAFGADQRLPSVRRPVPQSKMNCVPSGAINSRHGVFPPYRHVAGSTVGVEPRTPQKLSLATGAVIFLSALPCAKANSASVKAEWEASPMVAVAARRVNDIAPETCQTA